MNNPPQGIRVERLHLPPGEDDLRALASLLMDAVASGAAVSFLATLTSEEANAWWRKTLSAPHPRAIFLVARHAETVVGSVQMHPAWAPNQPQRGEIAKLLVHRRHRGKGLGHRLMQAIENEALKSGIRLLTLDAKRAEAAERLYRRMGWTLVGTIPQFALDPDGKTPHDAVIYYKVLAPAEA